MRTFYKYFLSFLTSAFLSGGATAGETKSVVLIVVDDLRPTLGAYGDRLARTPHIDALAEQSLVFEQAYAVVPVCGASRAAMMSGLKPTTARFLTYNSRLDRDAPKAVSLPAYFRKFGYETMAVGKIFDVTEDSASGWSKGVWNPDGRWHSPVPRETRHEDLQKAYVYPLEEKLGPVTERADVGERDYPDGEVAEKSISALKALSEAGDPFFLAIGFRKPHLPFTAPERYWQLYSGVEFPLPQTFAESDGLPRFALHNSPELRRQYSGIPASGLLQAPLSQELLHGYYAAVSYVDALIGQVLRAVDQLPEKPVVMLVSDHGWNLGEHTLWTKHSLFEITLRVPFVLRVPGEEPARRSGITDLLDTYPTLASAAGLPVPENSDGVDQLKVRGKTHSVARWFDGASVRTQRYRYTEWRDEENGVRDKMLFDLNADPHETQNIVASASEEAVKLSALITEDKSNESWAPLLHQMIEARRQGLF